MRIYQTVSCLALLIVSCNLCLADTGGVFGEVGMEGDWLTVGGEKFLVVGIGYEIGCRPGRVPWARDFQPDLLHADFKRIKAAGFNTLRTWAPMTDEELQVAAEYGLWVIQGIWYDSKGAFGDPAFQEKTLSFVREEITRSAKHPNILFYLVGNEPHGDAVYKAGREAVNDFYRKLVATSREADPQRLFTYANCVFADFMVPEMWDLTAHNAYPYSPVTIEKTLGYRGYLQTIKEQHAPGKPLVVTEFGLSVSEKGDGRGYGGNTLDVQRDGVVALWEDVLSVGAAGGCAFMWIDGWWKSGDENVHDNTSEEWYGLLGADDDPVGVPRPVYYALQEYNRAIRTLPVDGGVYEGRLPVEVWSPKGEVVEARIDEGEWIELDNERSWWRSELDLAPLSVGMHTVHTRMKRESGGWSSEKVCHIRVVGAGESDRVGLSVRFQDLPEQWEADTLMPVAVQVRDGAGAPVAGRQVSVSRFCHTGWSEYETSVKTDASGLATVDVPTHPHPGIISLAASVMSKTPDRNGTGWKQGPYKRHGDYRYVEVVQE